MRKISFLNIALVSLLALACSSPKAKQPNILFILADDLGYNDLSCMGSDFYETPNIDKIADEGTVFTNGYANCRVCSPSRASIMTGKFTARHDITVHIGSPSGVEWRKRKKYTKMLPAAYKHNLPLEYVTMPEALKNIGYKTFFAGKWHLGDKGSWPEDHGFDINKGGWSAGGPRGGYFAPYKNPNLIDEADGENLSMRLAKETAKFMREHESEQPDQPFFAYLSFYAVHAPIQTSEEKWRKYRDKAEKMGLTERKSAFKMTKYMPMRQVQDNPVYAGLIEQMDDAVGVVLNELKKLGLDDNTIVVFTGDNGGVAAGDNFSTCNAPLRGGKGYQFEGGIREPYFIKVPGLSMPGDKINYPVTGADFYPTLLDLAGGNLLPQEHNDGVSLLPLLKGKELAERPLIWHFPHYGNQGGEPSSIIRRGDWKLIHYYEDDVDVLYNLKDDISETRDLAPQYPDKVKKLHHELFAYLKEVNAKFPTFDPEYNAEAQQKYLKNLENKKMKALEKQRQQMFSKEFNPGNNWWGSVPTVD